MKAILMCLSLLFSGAVLAKQIELKVSSLYKKGNVTIKMNDVTIKAIMGKEFTVPATNGNPFKMKLSVSEFKGKVSENMDPNNSIMVKGDISVLENGKMKKIASPQVVTIYGQEATISMKDDKDGSFFEMKILPVKNL